MNPRLKSPILLGFLLPGLIVVLAVYGSLQLYAHTERKARERQEMLQKLNELEKELGASATERPLLQTWMKTVRGYFETATIDGFISTLMTSVGAKPEIISSSSVPMESYQGLVLKSAQQLTLRGSLNSLILAFGRAQMSFPVIVPVDWQLRRAPKAEALELEAQLVLPQIGPPATSGGKPEKTHP